MTEAQLSLDPSTGSVSLKLHIDLLRTAGSTDAYLQLAQTLDEDNHQPIWSALCEGILVEQHGQRLPLKFKSATPPVPFDQSEFADPFVWPRVWVSLAAEGYQAEHPLTIIFKPDFVFEEPISTTITDGSTRMSRWLVTNQRSPAFEGSAETASQTSESNNLASYLSTLWAGFTHILPDGWDHLLFVAAVLLSCTTLKQTALLVTAFTLGHSVSLAIAGFRLISIPTSIVEPMIWLSISIYALKASRVRRNQQATATPPALWPVVVIGLIHGLGFASAFNALNWSGSPAGHLFSFNLGIELAQLVFVVLAYTLLKRFSNANMQRLAQVLVILPVLVLVTSLSGCMSKQPNSPELSSNGFVDSDGLRIFYQRTGSGPPLVLVHGWGSDTQHNWVDSGWIAALRQHRTVLAIDVRGHGRSDKPYATAPYSYAAMSHDVLAVMNTLGIERADFMGYSMGSFIGAHLLGHKPERFTAMVLGGIGNETAASAAQGAVIAEALRAPDREAVADPLSLAVRNFVEQNPNNDLLALAYSADKMWPEGYPLVLAGAGIRDASFPVLIINGAKDHPYVDSADDFAHALPNGRHVQIPNTDHLSAVTDPTFKAIVIEFLQGR